MKATRQLVLVCMLGGLMACRAANAGFASFIAYGSEVVNFWGPGGDWQDDSDEKEGKIIILAIEFHSGVKGTLILDAMEEIHCEILPSGRTYERFSFPEATLALVPSPEPEASFPAREI